MAAATAMVSLCSLELSFLRPDISRRKRRGSLSKPRTRINLNFCLRTSIRAVQREESTLIEQRESDFELKLSGNGNGNGSSYIVNGSVAEYSNGSVGVVVENGASNGSLMKYVNGSTNGSAAAIGPDVLEMESEKVVVEKKKKKKTVEEIGQEEAWFKRSGRDQVEVQYYIR